MNLRSLRLLIVCVMSAIFPFIAPLKPGPHLADSFDTVGNASIGNQAIVRPHSIGIVHSSSSLVIRERARSRVNKIQSTSVAQAPSMPDEVQEQRLIRAEWQRAKWFEATLRAALRLFPASGILPATKGKSLIVDQSQQMLHVYEDGVEVRVMPISTGVWPMYTPAFRGNLGHYAGAIWAYGGWVDDAWYVFEAHGNIYIHSSPYTMVGDRKVYVDIELLGVRPSSHGCIRLHPDDARWLTQWNPAGASILITPLKWH